MCCSQSQLINIVPVTVDEVPSVFLTGATFIMQKHLEFTLGYEPRVRDDCLVNGLRGHLISLVDFDKPALIAILEKYGIDYADYL